MGKQGLIKLTAAQQSGIELTGKVSAEILA